MAWFAFGVFCPTVPCMHRAEIKVDSVNGHYQPTVAISHDHLDKLLATMKLHVSAFAGSTPHLWKADVDAAFRRVPVKPAHRWATGVAFVAGGRNVVSFHYSMPFGATSSVVAWHRIGEVICTIARRLLKLPVLRYVDDYFAAERSETVHQAMSIFAKLVRLMLGESAIAERKLEMGPLLVILGILVRAFVLWLGLHAFMLCFIVKVMPFHWGVRLRIDESRRRKLLATINEALSSGQLHSGAATKLAGKLMWATQFLFHRLGRAMIRAIFARATRSGGSSSITRQLANDLCWWRFILQQV